MEPLALVTKHSEIINLQVMQQRQLFVAIHEEVNVMVTRYVNQMIVDDKGICTNCKENKVLLQKALNALRVAMSRQRGTLNRIYGDGIAQIDTLVTDYITWQKSLT